MAFAYTNRSFFGKKAKQNTQTAIFYIILKAARRKCAALPYSLFAFTLRRKGCVSIFPRPAETGRRFFPFSTVPHSRLMRRTDIWTGWISDSACRLPGYKTVPPHGIAVPPPEKRQNLYGWSGQVVSSVIAVLRGAASYSPCGIRR